MAKGKGKSTRRMKGFGGRLASGEDLDALARHQKVIPPAVKLPPWRAAAPQDNLDALPKLEGLVVGLFPGGVIVRHAGDELLCGVAGTFRAPEGSSALAVGDVVTVAIIHDRHSDGNIGGDKDRADGMILSRQPRRSALSRPMPRSGKRRDDYEDDAFEKVIAANMDALLIVVSTAQPRPRRGLIDRFLIIAERGELTPIVVFNKIDLAEADPALLADLTDRKITLLACSAETGAGLDALRDLLGHKHSVLAGASGVGKSTLVNAIVPGAQAATRPIRLRDERGRHTTAAATVYDLAGGGVLVDTPGVRELGLRMQAAELPWYFPEFDAFAPACRFKDCSHTHEPLCAVQAAVEDGRIQPQRYESYLRLLETLEE